MVPIAGNGTASILSALNCVMHPYLLIDMSSIAGSDKAH